METGRHCAYNITRNLLLSEAVWCAEETLDPKELLALVMNGPGIDRHSCVWIRQRPGWADLPRLCALDFAYLDEHHKIIESGHIGPGTPFPPLSQPVTGTLILANRRLAETDTAAGDEVKICEQMELAALVKAASQSLVDAAVGPTQTAPGPAPPAPPTPYEVSRYSEFVFEPFAGSLVYLPQVEVFAPQATEYFLPDQGLSAPSAGSLPHPDAAESPVQDEGKTRVVRQKREAKEKIAPQHEEPQFYTPPPIRFFDPTAAAEGQDESPVESAPEGDQVPARQPTHLSPELKSAIHHIGEKLRRGKDELEAQRKPLSKFRKKKAQKAEPPEPAVQPSRDVGPLAEEAAALPEPSPAGLVAKATGETETEAWPQASVAEAPSPQQSIAEAEVSAVDREVLPEPVQAATELQRPPIGEGPALEVEPELAIEAPLSTPGLVEQPPLQVETTPAVANEPPWEAWEEEAQPALETVEPELAVEASLSAPGLVEHALFQVETTPAGENEARFEEEAVEPPAAREVEEIRLASAAVEPRTSVPGPKEVRRHVHEAPEPEPRPFPKKSKPAKEKLSLGERVHRWFSGDPSRRRGDRTGAPGLVAFYWSGGAPHPHEIVNISKSGFYLRTKELWLPGTLVRMTLQRHDETRGKESIGVLARVVRIDDGGVGHEFVTTDALHALHSRDVLPKYGTDQKELEKFLEID